MKKVILSAALAFTFAYAGAQNNAEPFLKNMATVEQTGSGSNTGVFNQKLDFAEGNQGNILSAKQIGSTNDMEVNQNGSLNIAGRNFLGSEKALVQNGNDNIMGIGQDGSLNRSMAEQVGNTNDLRLSQEGDRNKAGRGLMKLGQIGDENLMDITQKGNDNDVYTRQAGIGAELGNSNEFNLDQLGNSNQLGNTSAISEQLGDMNTADIFQNGTSNIGGLKQQGDQNNAELYQGTYAAAEDAQNVSDNHHNLANISSVGSYNDFRVTQYGSSNKLGGFGQLGDKNNIYVSQQNNENTASLSQNGTENKFIGSQVANENALSSMQLGNLNKAQAFQNGNGNIADMANSYIYNEDAMLSHSGVFEDGETSINLGLLQQGDNNDGFLWQKGDYNKAGVSQVGNDLNARLEQHNDNNFGFIKQAGNNHDASLLQNGCQNEAIIYQATGGTGQ